MTAFSVTSGTSGRAGSGRRRRLVALAAGLGLLMTPALAGDPATAQDSAPAAGVAPRPPIDLDEDAKAPKDSVTQDLWVRTPVDTDRDGKKDKVHIEVTRPKGQKRLATIFKISPYAAGYNDVPNHDVDHELWYPGKPAGDSLDRGRFVERGYAEVFAYSLGTGRSTGCPTVGDADETAGPKAVIDWLNGRAVARNAQGKKVKAGWATGKVGMIGTSYDGTLPNAVAATGVKGLKAIVPISAISSWYDYYRANGLVVAPGGYQGEDVDVLAKFVYSRKNQKICKPVMRRLARQQDRRSGDYSDFWRQRDFQRKAGKVKAAVLVAHGLRDWNVKPSAAARWYDALKQRNVDHMIYWHQGGHGGPPPNDVVDRWFDHYLYGADNGIDTQRKRSLIKQPDGSLQWEREWPLPSAKDRTWHLTAADDSGFGGFSDSPSTGSEKFTDDAAYNVQRLVDEKATDHGRIYATDALEKDTRMSGIASTRLRLAFGAKAANVSVGLVDLKPDGSVQRVVTYGWADPQNAASLTRSQALKPGQPVNLDFDLEANDYTFAAGHRIGYVVMSSEHDFTIRPKPGTSVDVKLAKSSVTLPLVD